MNRLIQIVGGLVTICRDGVTILVDTVRDEISIIREGEEYILGPDGRKVVAREPGGETPVARGCDAPLLGGDK